MAEVLELSTDEESFIKPYLPAQGRAVSSSAADKPFVTLTYACSLDGMISISPGVQTALSGPETKSMTHFLRLNHDAILVGVGTAIADDPSLTCRYPGRDLVPAIQPIVLDPQLRWDMACSKVKVLARDGKGSAPWIVHAAGAPAERPATELERYIVAGQTASGKLEWCSILEALGGKGIRSVMIEGGATVINDLLAQPELVDSVIVTIAPTWLGQGGVTVSPAPAIKEGVRVNAARLQKTSWRQFGQDAVVCGRLS